MKFGPVAVTDAEGAILAHSVECGGRKIRKGSALNAAQIVQLHAAGFSEVIVAVLEPGDVHEDVAATKLADALVPDPAGQLLRTTRAATGRVNLHSTREGVMVIDAAAIHAVNAVEPMITVATIAPFQRVAAGEMVATIKVISYAVDDAALQRAIVAAQKALSIAPPVYANAALIETSVTARLPSKKGWTALKARLDRLNVDLQDRVVVPHRADDVAAALGDVQADVVFILTGSATSDMHDIAPDAVRQAGGEVIHFGMPVDPGNLLFLGRMDGRPVIGLPGCARSPAMNGADWVLERVICGIKVGPDDIAAMGVGGLLKEIPIRPRPREG